MEQPAPWHRLARTLLAGGIACLLSSTVARAQSGTLSGVVIDETGARVRGVSLTLA